MINEAKTPKMERSSEMMPKEVVSFCFCSKPAFFALLLLESATMAKMKANTHRIKQSIRTAMKIERAWSVITASFMISPKKFAENVNGQNP